MTSPTQEFTSRNLGWMRRHRRQFGLKVDSGKLPRTRQEWTEFLGALENSLADETFDFERLKVSHVKQGAKSRQIVSTRSLNEVLVLRRINENIRRAYGIKNPNRSALVRTVSQALQEGTKKSILRVDIKSCFESIPKSLMLRRLMSDGLVSFQTISLLTRLFLALESRPGYERRKGLPRGLAISSTLAEVYLLGLERHIRTLPGVYLVVRYVDDLVIVSSDLQYDLYPKVKDAVQSFRLKLNPAKTDRVVVACTCDSGCGHGKFCPCDKTCVCDVEAKTVEYLGYSFVFNNRNAKSGSNEVAIRLSSAKIRKAKTRVIIASREYVKNNDFSLYLKRLNYIVGNFQLISSEGSRGLSTGLAYTHSEYNVPLSDEKTDGDLALLTDFLRRSLRFSLKLRPQPKATMSHAYKCDFVSGYHLKRRVKLPSAELKSVTGCWRHV